MALGRGALTPQAGWRLARDCRQAARGRATGGCDAAGAWPAFADVLEDVHHRSGGPRLASGRHHRDDRPRQLDPAQRADLEVSGARNERMREPEIDRMRASLELRRGDVAGAEASLQLIYTPVTRPGAFGRPSPELLLQVPLTPTEPNELSDGESRSGQGRSIAGG